MLLVVPNGGGGIKNCPVKQKPKAVVVTVVRDFTEISKVNSALEAGVYNSSLELWLSLAGWDSAVLPAIRRE